MSHELRKTIELDASPEAVWEAIATGPGISTWFVPHQVQEHVGGEATAQFGAGNDVAGRVLAWEPGKRVVFGSAEPAPEGGPDYAMEFLVEGRDGGGTVLRFVQSGFTDEGWENEYNSLDAGWDLFFDNLRNYFAHFAPLPVHNVVTMAFTPGSATDLWPALYSSLGLAGRPSVGETVTLRPDGPPAITGVVDVASGKFLGVRSEHGLHRIGAEGEAGCGISAFHYFYGPPVDSDALTAAWQSWLEQLAAPEPART